MKFFFITLFFIIIISGCTQTTTDVTDLPITSSSNGLAVINFTSDFNTLRVNEQTNIKTVYHNYGDFEARNIKSVLYGEGLLERLNEINTSDSLLKERETFHFWTLQVPLKLSQTESTNYVLSNRIYYNYNYSGFQQVAFVSPDYTGGDVPLSSGVSKSPITVAINTRNPIRTLPSETEGTIFTVTTTVTNQDEGNVNYYGCSALDTPPCHKNTHLNEFRLSVPVDWVEVTDMSGWILDNKGNIDDWPDIANGHQQSYDTPITSGYLQFMFKKEVDEFTNGNFLVFKGDGSSEVAITLDYQPTEKTFNLLINNEPIIEGLPYNQWLFFKAIWNNDQASFFINGEAINYGTWTLDNVNEIQINDLKTNVNIKNIYTSNDSDVKTYTINYDLLKEAYDRPRYNKCDDGECTTCSSIQVSNTTKCIEDSYKDYNTKIINCQTEGCVVGAREDLEYNLSNNDNCIDESDATCTGKTYDICKADCAKDSDCSGVCGCYYYYPCQSCRQVQGVTYCNRLSEAINHLRMIRGNEARIVLQFAKPEVDETVIDTVKVSGDFGYEIDVADFTNRISLNILGD